MKNNYSKACTEILEIIKYFPKEEYAKIPKEEIRKFEENMDKNYNFRINLDENLSEQGISKETNAILVKLFQDYFATEKQQVIIKNLLRQNLERIETEKRNKYSFNNIFEKNAKKFNKIYEKEQSFTEYKKGFFVKFKTFILKILKK